jgi:regulatory protein
MTVTQLQTTKRGRISVYVDGEFLFAAESDSVMRFGISEGCEVDEQLLNELLKDSRLIEAKRRALNMLSARDYSGEQLAERLARRTGSESAHAAVERMQELGLVDDGKYALRCALQLFEKGFAQRRIRYELQKRKLSENVISDTLEQIDFGDGADRAKQLLTDKMGSVTTESDRRKAAAFLERCGYSYSDINTAIRRLYRAEDDDF